MIAAESTPDTGQKQLGRQPLVSALQFTRPVQSREVVNKDSDWEVFQCDISLLQPEKVSVGRV